MTQLGERLRTAREERGLSLAEAATATRILPRYLQALEAGDFASLPGDVYARGFVRNYAQLLDLPSEELILLYRQERGESTGKIKVVPAAMPPRTRSCLFPSISLLGTFFAIILLVAVAYFAAQATGLLATHSEAGRNATATRVPATPTSFPTAAEATKGPTSAATSANGPAGSGETAGPDGGPAVAGTPTAGTPGPNQTTPPVPGQLVVEVSVPGQGSGSSWMEVRVDGLLKFNALMRTGGYQRFTPQRDIYMNIGDTSAVTLSVNGQPCAGFPGAVRGVPRRVTIPVTGGCP